jgi:hypothetical protein
MIHVYMHVAFRMFDSLKRHWKRLATLPSSRMAAVGLIIL